MTMSKYASLASASSFSLKINRAVASRLIIQFPYYFLAFFYATDVSANIADYVIIQDMKSRFLADLQEID